MTIAETTLADLVISRPQAARVLYRHRLDFCCGGRRTLSDACTRSGADTQAILQEIDALAEEPADVHAEGLSPVELIDLIVTRYHEPLRAELPRLIELATKVERVHRDKAACPRGLTAHLTEMRYAIHDHLEKEEQILFPMVRAGRGALARNPVQVMMLEHDDHAANLRRMRQFARDLVVPAEACTSWRNLYDSLSALELDLMRHIHLENNVLFPAVLAG